MLALYVADVVGVLPGRGEGDDGEGVGAQGVYVAQATSLAGEACAGGGGGCVGGCAGEARARWGEVSGRMLRGRTMTEAEGGFRQRVLDELRDFGSKRARDGDACGGVGCGGGDIRVDSASRFV